MFILVNSSAVASTAGQMQESASQLALKAANEYQNGDTINGAKDSSQVSNFNLAYSVLDALRSTLVKMASMGVAHIKEGLT